MEKLETGVSHSEDSGNPQPAHHALKTSKDGLILVPQPTDDPNDPLVRQVSWS
jgi:hypothetical protein